VVRGGFVYGLLQGDRNRPTIKKKKKKDNLVGQLTGGRGKQRLGEFQNLITRKKKDSRQRGRRKNLGGRERRARKYPRKSRSTPPGKH